MDVFVIKGGKKLNGSIEVGGSKNAALPILAATLLTEQKCIIENVPNISDIRTMLKILKNMGSRVQFANNTITTETGKDLRPEAPYKFVSTMRASICVLGPLLARAKYAKVSFPGGCVIGPRPIDLHLKGLKELGASIDLKDGYIIARAKRMRGKVIYLGGNFGSSVLATANVMMAATLSQGTTVIENASCEPEIVDLAKFLVKMGANIQGYSTPTVIIKGVKRLNGVQHRVIPDRVEAGTFMIAGAITGGNITVKKVVPEHLTAVLDKMREVGIKLKIGKDTIGVSAGSRIKSTDITTLPFPGFPTDLQAQFMTLTTLADGISVITEKVFPRRFIHVSELNRMGANIFVEGASAIIKGAKKLSGAAVMASDLRASAALVLAGLVASGTTVVRRVYHIDRGYENIDKKLNTLGAQILRQKE